jgi:hypothetical protein
MPSCNNFKGVAGCAQWLRHIISCKGITWGFKREKGAQLTAWKKSILTLSLHTLKESCDQETFAPCIKCMFELLAKSKVRTINLDFARKGYWHILIPSCLAGLSFKGVALCKAHDSETIHITTCKGITWGFKREKGSHPDRATKETIAMLSFKGVTEILNLKSR